MECKNCSRMRRLNFFILSLNLLRFTSGEKVECSDDIDESINDLSQDDPILVDMVKNYFLMSPADDNLKYDIPPERLRPPMVHGQFQQALIVDTFYNKSKTEGFFIEAGAFDGYTLSNSLFFEAQRNWNGLLVEAHPDNYEVLASTNRKAWSSGACLSMKQRPDIVHFDAATIFGGIIQEGRPKPGDSLPSTDRERLRELTEKTRRTIKMQCLPLYSMLLALGNPTVDYMSLDIEGSELQVLQTLPWDKVDIKIIGLEILVAKSDDSAPGEHHNQFDEIKDLLTKQGYDLIRRDWHTPEKKALEAYFVKKDLAALIDRKYFKL